MAITHNANSARPRAGVRRVLAAAVTAAALFGLAACTDAEDDAQPAPQVEGTLPAETQAALQEAVEYAIATGGATGAIVGVWVPWSGEWVAGIGTTGPNGQPVTAEMSFRGATVTRMMTCDVLYGLAKDGVVHLDDPVSTFIAGSNDLSDISLKQLCDSSAGIGASGPQIVPMWYRTPERVWAPKEIAMWGRAQDLAPPGLRYHDSDAGYNLLGYALERASRESLEDLYVKYATGPLGLESTMLPGDAPATPSPEPYLPGYYTPVGPEGARNCAEPVDISRISASLGFADAGITTTIRDLGTYVKADAAQTLPWQLGDDPSQQRFSNPLPMWEGAPTWMNASGGSFIIGPLIGQYGFVPGYSTAAFSDPATGFTVAVVLNNSETMGAYAQSLALQLAAIASKAPAAAGQTAPEFGLPFSADSIRNELGIAAICPAPGEAVEEVQPTEEPAPPPPPPSPQDAAYENEWGEWIVPWIEWRELEDGTWVEGYWNQAGEFIEGYYNDNDEWTPGRRP